MMSFRSLCLVFGLVSGFSATVFPHGGSHSNVNKEKASDKIADGREIDLEFTSHIVGNLPVEMTPLTPKMKAKIGKRYKVEYRFKNNSDKDIPIYAVHSVFPTSQGAVFKKYVCFCFESQTLKKGADITMPIEFRVTKELAADLKALRIDYKLYEKRAPLKREPLKPTKSKHKHKRKVSLPEWQEGKYGVLRRDGLMQAAGGRRV